MIKCIECGYEFTNMEKAKAGFSFRGHLKCPKCKSVYKAEGIIRSIYYFTVILTFFIITDRVDLLNTFLDYVLAGVVLAGILILFDIIPHRWQKYRKIK